MVRNSQQEAEAKRRLDMAEKRARTRAELQQKIIKENQRRLAIEVCKLSMGLLCGSRSLFKLLFVLCIG